MKLVGPPFGPGVWTSRMWSLFMLTRITSQVAEKIRPTVDKYQAAFPALLEIPSKEHPYGASPVPAIEHA